MTAPVRTITAALLGALALAAPASASTVLHYDGHGNLAPRKMKALPPPTGPEAPAAPDQACIQPKRAPRVRAAGPSVKQAIQKARKRGKVSAKKARGYLSAYRKARRTRNRLHSYRSELGSVIAVLQGIARRGKLTPSRMPALFLQLRRNTQFWAGDPHFPPRTDGQSPCAGRSGGPAGARITFEGSELVFQYYPGAGLQIQPLANFGLANGLREHCERKPDDCEKGRLRKLLRELVAIRSHRGGFTTWEYWFYFGGGTPPWTSGLSQGTAIQALAHASKPGMLDKPGYLKVARNGLGAFLKPPPVGVRVKTDGGSHYLIYSFSRGERVLNAFLQAITGIYDYAQISHDALARKIWKRGDRAARRELHRFDTGSWSLYSEGGPESTLSYHRLVTEFLGNLCDRLHGRYCRYFKRFTSYLGKPPVLRYAGRDTGSEGSALRLRFTIDKPSCVTAEVYNSDGKRVFAKRKRFARGTHSFKWTPRHAGDFRLRLEAVDRALNETKVKQKISVT